MESANQPLAVMKGVGKRYGAMDVLAQFNLEVLPGDFITLIGASGCGKTTLLRLFAGLTGVTDGELRLSTSEAGLSYIFQDATLLPWRTALGNVELPMQLAGIAREERHKQARALMELVGLGDAMRKYPRQLSGGMKMRTSLARGLARRPSLMLMDEPFGALDAMTRNRLNEELLSLRERQPFAALFVTHSVSEAVFLSNRIIVMDSDPGRIFAEERISFAYPRTHQLREQPEYYEKVAWVTALLNKVQGGGQ